MSLLFHVTISFSFSSRSSRTSIFPKIRSLPSSDFR